MVITLPYVQGVRRAFPQARLDFLTRREVSAIPASVRLYDRIFRLRGGRNARLQFLFALLMLPLLWARRYDTVVDLQNNRISRFVRRMLFPRRYAAFDVQSPLSAGERTQQTIRSLWQDKIDPVFRFDHEQHRDKSLLAENGYVAGHELVVLNPAGFCPSRQWPLENYVDFARRWLETVNPSTQFLLLLMPAGQEKARYIKDHLGERCVDLTGKADQVAAFEIISRCSLMLSEDSGLMHMAWVQGVPTVALFSSSRKDWSAPQQAWSLCLDSSDLECGPCQQEVCIFGDNRCLTRYSADFVVKRARPLRRAEPAYESA